MHCKKLKRNNGYVAADAVLGIGIFIVLSSLVILLVINIYNTNLSMHRTSMATNYAVEILENAKLLDYTDPSLQAGEYEGKNLLKIKHKGL